MSAPSVRIANAGRASGDRLPLTEIYRKMTPRRIARGLVRRAGLHRIWIPGVRPFRLSLQDKEFIDCHACGAREFCPFIRDPGHQVVRCGGCGLYYVNPRPSALTLNRRVQESAAYTEDQLRKLEFFQRRAERLFDRVEKLVRPGRLLDVGCAIGTELAVGKQRGWDVTGVELSESSVRFAREAGFEVRSAPLPASGFPDQAFDLITMNHVLEHIADTPPVMREVRRLLSRNGLLFISLPNVHAWKFYLRRGSYDWTFHTDHYIHFSIDTLSKFLNRNGFEVIDISTSRWTDYHDPVESRSRLFQWVDRMIENMGMGIEIFCLARPRSL